MAIFQDIDERRFPERTSMAQALADRVGETLAAAVGEGGRAGLVVSGGSTPAAMFERLSTYPLPWSQIDVTLADERWVSVDSERSNQNLVRRHLLR